MLRDRALLDERGRLATDAEIVVPDSIQSLIAARLDTLPADRKRLLQDAAVIGKVFWAGAAAAMGGREAVEVEDAFSDLVRRELIRPAAQSSMEGEREYGFWHALVRDVAYAQIPRAERASRHLRAVDWIEQKAGDRLEDVADVLAYHADEARSLARATRDAALEAEARPVAARYALLAGERALGLDNARAIELLERAHSLTPEDDPAFARVLVRRAVAIEDSGRMREAAAALERVAEQLEARGDAFYAGQAWSRLGFLRRRVVGRDFLPLHERAVALLEPTPGPELVDALAEFADGLFVSPTEDDWRRGIAIADRALALAAELGLPPPGWALGARGSCRGKLGDPGGIADLENAVRILEEAGDRRALFVLHNLGHLSHRLDGPVVALETYDRVVEIGEARGNVPIARWTRANRCWELVELGRLAEVLDESPALLPLLRESGDLYAEIGLLASRLIALFELGGDATAAAADLDDALERHGIDDPDDRVLVALAAGDAARLAGALDRRAGLQREEAPPPRLVRAAASLGDADLVERLTAGTPDVFPEDRYAIVSQRAVKAELAGRFDAAATLYAEAAASWESFGNLLEQAYALLGQARALERLGDPAFEVPLRDARALFERMEGLRGIDECDDVREPRRPAGESCRHALTGGVPHTAGIFVRDGVRSSDFGASPGRRRSDRVRRCMHERRRRRWFEGGPGGRPGRRLPRRRAVELRLLGRPRPDRGELLLRERDLLQPALPPAPQHRSHPRAGGAEARAGRGDGRAVAHRRWEDLHVPPQGRHPLEPPVEPRRDLRGLPLCAGANGGPEERRRAGGAPGADRGLGRLRSGQGQDDHAASRRRIRRRSSST